MKKLLMLGGSFFQIPAIKAAVRMGYHVVTCDYAPNNPGHQYAHEYYNVSTTDKDAVLNLARRIKADGVVCYASDPAAATAAYVCEKMGFPTNPYESVEILSKKDLFRTFLKTHGFNVPQAKSFSSIIEAEKEIGGFRMPVLIKPVDSSGSRGVSKLEDRRALSKQAEYAMSFSRVKRIIIEEWVEKDGCQVSGDGFSVKGELVFRCFANHHFEQNTNNPFVPIASSWPYNKPAEIHQKIHNEIQRLLTALDMNTGAYNFEIRIDKEGKVFLMEVGPRNGGNLIPQVTKYATGVDMVEYTIKAAMGIDCSDLRMQETNGFWAYYALHSEIAGVYKGIDVSEDLKRDNIVKCNMYCKQGDTIEAFTNSSGTLGTMILKFSSMEEMLEKIDTMARLVRLEVEPMEINTSLPPIGKGVIG